jgi:hypothetical protein
MKDINELIAKLPELADIIFVRGKSATRIPNRTMPKSLVKTFSALKREVSSKYKLSGKTFMAFADEYIIVSKRQEWKFFLQDEKELIEKFCENATKFVNWGSK